METAITNTLIEVGTDLVGKLAYWIVAALFAWVLAKIGKNKKLQNIAAAIGEVENAAKQTVLELQQTVVEGLKEASKDGKLTKNEISVLNGMLFDKTVEKVSEPSIKILEASKADMAAIITSAGEAAVYEIKNSLLPVIEVPADE